MINEKQAKKYCCEDISLIENYYEAVNSPEKWECHHKLGTQYSINELKEMNKYFNVNAEDLIFLSKSEHDSLHLSILNMKYKRFQTPWNKGKKGLQICWNKGGHWSEKTKQKISNSLKGNIPVNKGVPQPKYKWKTPSGEIKIMDENNVKRWHPDWIKIGEV